MDTVIFRQLLIPALCLAGLFALAQPQNANATQLYRYKDSNGNVVMGRTIPPELVGQGYEILNEKGRVVERVKPALTPEQIAARDARLEKEKQEQAAREEQIRADNELKQLYSHPNDAVRILKRRVQDIDAVISVKLGKIEAAHKDTVENEAKAASIQRNGATVPEHLLAKIESRKQEIINARADIKALERERKNVMQEFDEKIRRLEVITKKPATDYPALREELNKSSDESQQEEGK